LKASTRGHLKAVKILFENRANIEKKDKAGCTSLIWGKSIKSKLIKIIIFITASRNGHIEVVKELISKSAMIDAKCKNGSTALLWGDFTFR
jgi:ankyrin repeat protein